LGKVVRNLLLVVILNKREVLLKLFFLDSAVKIYLRTLGRQVGKALYIIKKLTFGRKRDEIRYVNLMIIQPNGDCFMDGAC
jgi:hypothetical protein